MSGLTKIFIVLQLVFSVALSVLLVLMVSKQDNYKVQLLDANSGRLGLIATNNRLQTQVTSLTAANTDLVRQSQIDVAAAQKSANDASAQLADAKRTQLELEQQRSSLQNQLNSMINATSTFKDTQAKLMAELDKLRPQVSALTKENAELSRANNDSANSLRAAEKAIETLKIQVAEAEATPKTGGTAVPAEVGGQTLTATNQTSVPVNGQITNLGTSAGKPLIETNLGTRDGVKTSTQFAIYRGSKYVGDAVVQRVTQDQSVAIVVVTKPGETVQKGDVVQSGN